MDGGRIVALSIIAACFFSSCAPGSNHPVDIAYASQSDGRVYAFDITNNRVAVVGKGYLGQRNGKYLEFVGHIEDCSTISTHCISGGFPVTVPKLLTASSKWPSAGRARCAVEAREEVSGRQVYRFTCRGEPGTFAETFWYSRDRGIEAFRSSEPGETRFKLVDAKGLFARN